VQDWLQQNGLEQYQETFWKNEIDGGVLTEMDDFDLVILSIEYKDQDLILNIVKKAKKSLKQIKMVQKYQQEECLSDRPEQHTRNSLLKINSLNIFSDKRSNTDSGTPRKHRSHISAPIPRIQIDEYEDINLWNTREVIVFLKKNSMIKHCAKFRANAIDGPALLDLRIKDFQILGMKTDEALLIYLALNTYKYEKSLRK